MGEYAKYRGREVKIGTCEDMYYLRADQARDVQPISNSLNPWRERYVLRFRFPFPDEDGTEPGAFEPYERGYTIPQGYVFEHSDPTDHHSIQLVSNYPSGYLVSLPCPQSGRVIEGAQVMRNGGPAGWQITKQKFLRSDGDGPDTLAVVISCAICRVSYRVEDAAEAHRIAECFRLECLETDFVRGRRELRYGADSIAFMGAMADRIEAGYRATVPA